MNRTNSQIAAKWRNRLLASVFGLAAATGAANAQMTTPPMSGPLKANPNPYSVDVPDFLGPFAGKAYITGTVSGMAFYQDNTQYFTPGDRPSMLDLVEGQVFIQKTDGWFQWFVQAGQYTVHSLGVPYIKTSAFTPNTFGIVPQAFIKIAPTDNFSIVAGKIPTLIGAEYTFSFQNTNITRGLLWGQENAVNQGVQVNYSTGPISLSVSWNDGFYSSKLNWITGLATWTIDSDNILAFAGGGNVGHTNYGRAFTTVAVNNESIYNLMYTHISGDWTIAPYLQYSSVPANAAVGFAAPAETLGAAVLTTYSFSDTFKLSARAEYIKDQGTKAGAANLLYGQGSDAYSFTITPTYQVGVWYVRPELSYVAAGGITPGLGLGALGISKSQTRAVLQAGVVF